MSGDLRDLLAPGVDLEEEPGTERIHASDPALRTRVQPLDEGRSLIIHEELEQGMPEWFYARMGKLTGSRFSSILTPKTGKPSIQGIDLALLLAIERIRGAPISLDFRTAYADRGLDVEPEARDWYAMHNGTTPYTAGFVERTDLAIGVSPDALVDDDPEGPGGCEIKCRAPVKHTKGVLGWDTIADATQIQASLFVTERNWWDEVAYCPGLPSAINRHRPDPTMQAQFRELVPKFLEGVERIREQVEAFGPIRRDGDLTKVLERSLDTLYKPEKKEEADAP